MRIKIIFYLTGRKIKYKVLNRFEEQKEEEEAEEKKKPFLF